MFFFLCKRIEFFEVIVEEGMVGSGVGERRGGGSFILGWVILCKVGRFGVVNYCLVCMCVNVCVWIFVFICVYMYLCVLGVW